MTDDAFDLNRFVTAQEGSYEQAVAELRAGRKTSHWIWYVFPQIAGLGTSAMSQRYAISSRDEARAYLAHPVLGSRLGECARIVAESDAASAQELLGGIDAVKLRSSMTLFANVSEDPIYTAVLEKYFDGEQDPATVRRI